MVLYETLLSERFDWLPGLIYYVPGHVPGIRIITQQPFISWISTRADQPGLDNRQSRLRVVPEIPTPKSDNKEYVALYLIFFF
jgi:hypothetical protein